MRLAESSSGRTKSLSSTCLPRMGISLATWSLLAIGGMLAPPASAQEVLPFQPTPSASTPGLTMKDSIYKKRADAKHLAADAPNILIILMDDVGPGQASTYGGEINTPTLTRIAQLGISYNRFHSTAMCSPTRGALLSGRNHTRISNGQIAELANDFDGFSGTIPKSAGTVAEVLKDYGYNTGAWGKWHNTPAQLTTSKGPFDYWPTGYGFEYFYGFLAGEASQYEPPPGAQRRRSWIRTSTSIPVITSPRTLPRTLSSGCAKGRRTRLISHFSSIGHRARHMALIRSPRNGRTNIRASSTTAGISIASVFLSVRSKWVGFRRMRNSRLARRRWPRGIPSRQMKSRSSAV